jgi:hypothetical protein
MTGAVRIRGDDTDLSHVPGRRVAAPGSTAESGNEVDGVMDIVDLRVGLGSTLE